MLLNFQCHRSENNTVDPLLPLIVFVFFLELDIIFFSSASNSVSISFTPSLNRIRGLRPFAVHLRSWEELLPDNSMQNARVEETIPLYNIILKNVFNRPKDLLYF